jgi:hypothetical protein
MDDPKLSWLYWSNSGGKDTSQLRYVGSNTENIGLSIDICITAS